MSKDAYTYIGATTDFPSIRVGSRKDEPVGIDEVRQFVLAFLARSQLVRGNDGLRGLDDIAMDG